MLHIKIAEICSKYIKIANTLFKKNKKTSFTLGCNFLFRKCHYKRQNAKNNCAVERSVELKNYELLKM